MPRSGESPRLLRIEELSLMDLAAVRLVLRGESIVDWKRLHLSSHEEARALLEAMEFLPDEPLDRARLQAIQSGAVEYLQRHFDFQVPASIAESTVEDLLVLASGKGQRQTAACMVLKAMHVIHHVAGRELLAQLSISDKELFHLAEQRIFRVVGSMLSSGFPIAEFVGGRKNKDSLYTKLLSRRETTAAAIYDKLRFRIVVRDLDDVLPTVHHLAAHLFPFTLVVPGQTINTLINFEGSCATNPHFATLKREWGQNHREADDDGGDEAARLPNVFSDATYRIVRFIVDMPIRVPGLLGDLPPEIRKLAPIAFVLCEFQIADEHAALQNESGPASHAKYKERQREAVKRRLNLGRRPETEADPKRRSR